MADKRSSPFECLVSLPGSGDHHHQSPHFQHAVLYKTVYFLCSLTGLFVALFLIKLDLYFAGRNRYQKVWLQLNI